MTNKTNNERLKLFILHPLFIFLCSALANHIAIARTFELENNGMLFLAVLNGISYDLLIPIVVFIAGITLVEHFRIVRGVALGFLYSMAILPIIDYLYFSVTYSRFNWSILHDINIYSIKAIIGSFSLSAIILITICTFFMAKLALRSFRAYNSLDCSWQKVPAKYLLYSALIVVVFFPVEYYQSASNFSPVILPVMTKNLYLTTLGNGSLYGYISDSISPSRNTKFTEYSEQERDYLQKLGLLPEKVTKNDFQNSEHTYSRIIIVIFESLALEYLHSHNKKVPAIASDYFDYLIDSYPHCENFYTSDSPTINGLNAILNSDIPYESSYYSVYQPTSVVRLFKEKHAANTAFIRGISKFYSGENLLLKSLFGFDRIIAYEDLAQSYPKPPAFLWGFSDDIVLNETLKVLRTEKNEPCFVVAKLIDLHQPPFYCGIADENLPKEIARHPSPIIKSVYWANHLLKNFVEACQKENLIDESTLLIITADHYPPLGYGHQDLFDNPQLFQLGRLPLIFVTENTAPLKNLGSSKMCCQIDLAPTICDLSGLQQPEQFKGNSLLLTRAPERMTGHFNGTMFWKNDADTFSAKLGDHNFPDPAVQKWLNNLMTVKQN